nr:FAD-binding oxidoreductase [uncultured Gellertiella sp.]
MPGPDLTPFRGDSALPDAVDVVVIGGGVIGAFTALELAERGKRVLLSEKGEIGGEQSSRNWGWVRLAMRDPREVPLMALAMRLWDGLDRRLEAQTGFVRSGITFACETPEALASHEGWLGEMQRGGYGLDRGDWAGLAMLTQEGLKQQFPGLSTRARAALHAPLDGRAEPQRVAPAVAEAARRHGAAIVTGCAVLGIDWRNGRIAGVETERGPVRCAAVVLAGGVWSGSLARLEGLDLPQLRVLNTVLRTGPLDGPAGALWTDKYAFRRRADGGYTIASAAENIIEIVPDSFRHAARFSTVLRQEWRSLRPRVSRHWLDEWRMLPAGRKGQQALLTGYRVLDPRPATATLMRALARLKQEFPAFRAADIRQTWAGMIDVTPDAVPVISTVEGREGLAIATGFSGHGFGISPAAGRLAADLVTGEQPTVDPHEFRLARFSDGSAIRVMGGV